MTARLCTRCRLPLTMPGTATCLHVQVPEPDLRQALRGAIALEWALTNKRSNPGG